ncbi:MAG TPA: hypothetical protein ENN29_12390, partial [Candidatus Hydrogenedentes bacterium]|nr:hypothetical protein [Candidatus Hydrogenedentota bacterium]
MRLSDDIMEKEVVAFLRDALAQRYDAANIRNYGGFDAFSDAQLRALRDFGLRHIYPEWESRRFQQEAFDALMALLNNPSRLKPLVAVALKSLWRFGRRLPRAIDAGKEVVRAFEATRALEQNILDRLRETDFETTEASDAVTQALKAIPRRDYETFINDMTNLMRLLADRSLLDTGLAVLKDIAAAMEKRADCYEPVELEGVRYALNIMEEGMALFDSLDSAAVEAAIEAVSRVERDW